MVTRTTCLLVPAWVPVGEQLFSKTVILLLNRSLSKVIHNIFHGTLLVDSGSLDF